MEKSWQEAYIAWLTLNLKRGEIRQALSHADHPSMMERSYPYLSRWFSGQGDRFQEVIRFHSSALAQSKISHKEGVSLGNMANRLQGKISKDSVETRIMVMYGQGLKGLHKNVISLLRIAASKGLAVDYGDILFLYLNWEKTDKNGNKYARRKLLNDFYGNIKIEDSVDIENNKENNLSTLNKEQ